jgi:uncharacterized protein (TIGR02145 family)
MKTKILLILNVFVFSTITTICQETDTLRDSRDGKIYRTVKIGEQTWMAQNLNFKTKAYCWCYRDDTTNCDKYGKLYRWEAAMKACPSGWHLPSEKEWDILIGYLGGKKVAGGKMKSPTGWENSDGTDQDSYGFSALPAGMGEGSYRNSRLGEMAAWWTSTKPEMGFSPCFVYIWQRKGEKIGIESTRVNSQFSVRCIKDN